MMFLLVPVADLVDAQVVADAARQFFALFVRSDLVLCDGVSSEVSRYSPASVGICLCFRTSSWETFEGGP